MHTVTAFETLANLAIETFVEKELSLFNDMGRLLIKTRAMLILRHTTRGTVTGHDGDGNQFLVTCNSGDYTLTVKTPSDTYVCF